MVVGAEGVGVAAAAVDLVAATVESAIFEEAGGTAGVGAAGSFPPIELGEEDAGTVGRTPLR